MCVVITLYVSACAQLANQADIAVCRLRTTAYYVMQRINGVLSIEHHSCLCSVLLNCRFGVAKCFTDHGLHAVSEQQQFIGSSAGGITAMGMGLDG
jgi:hypothetical protein